MSELIPTGMFTDVPQDPNQESGRAIPLVDSTPPKDGPQDINAYIKKKYNTYWAKIPHPKTDWCRIMEPAYADRKEQCESETLYYRMIPIHNSYSFTLNFDSGS